MITTSKNVTVDETAPSQARRRNCISLRDFFCFGEVFLIIILTLEPPENNLVVDQTQVENKGPGLQRCTVVLNHLTVEAELLWFAVSEASAVPAPCMANWVWWVWRRAGSRGAELIPSCIQ